MSLDRVGDIGSGNSKIVPALCNQHNPHVFTQFGVVSWSEEAYFRRAVLQCYNPVFYRISVIYAQVVSQPNGVSLVPANRDICACRPSGCACIDLCVVYVKPSSLDDLTYLDLQTHIRSFGGNDVTPWIKPAFGQAGVGGVANCVGYALYHWSGMDDKGARGCLCRSGLEVIEEGTGERFNGVAHSILPYGKFSRCPIRVACLAHEQQCVRGHDTGDLRRDFQGIASNLLHISGMHFNPGFRGPRVGCVQMSKPACGARQKLRPNQKKHRGDGRSDHKDGHHFDSGASLHQLVHVEVCNILFRLDNCRFDQSGRIAMVACRLLLPKLQRTDQDLLHTFDSGLHQQGNIFQGGHT